MFIVIPGKRLFGPDVIPDMRKTLIVYSEFVFVSMLNDVEIIVANLEWELERSFHLFVRHDGLSILNNLLFARYG